MNAKLDAKTRNRIAARFRNGESTVTELAAEFGVSRQNIYELARRRGVRPPTIAQRFERWARQDGAA